MTLRRARRANSSTREIERPCVRSFCKLIIGKECSSRAKASALVIHRFTKNCRGSRDLGRFFYIFFAVFSLLACFRVLACDAVKTTFQTLKSFDRDSFVTLSKSVRFESTPLRSIFKNHQPDFQLLQDDVRTSCCAITTCYLSQKSATLSRWASSRKRQKCRLIRLHHLLRWVCQVLALLDMRHHTSVNKLV
jgi:hypothetical protein